MMRRILMVLEIENGYIVHESRMDSVGEITVLPGMFFCADEETAGRRVRWVLDAARYPNLDPPPFEAGDQGVRG